MSDQFDAWQHEDPSLKEQRGRSIRTTGVILILGVFAGILCLMGMLVALNFGIVRPQQERIVSGTATADANATARIQRTADYSAELAEVPSGWERLLDEPFDSARLWSVGTDESNYGVSEISIHDGRLHWDVTTETGIFSYRTPDLESTRGVDLRDFWVSVETDVIEHNSVYGGEVGIIFRQNGPRYYVFDVTPNGYYAVMYHDQLGWETLVDWKSLPSYVGEPPYKLTVRGEGDHFFFFVNDFYLTDIHNDRILLGRVGLCIGVNEGSEHIKVEFDNMTVYAPELTTPTPTTTPNPNDPMVEIPSGWSKVFSETFRTPDTEWDNPTLLIGEGSGESVIEDGWLVLKLGGNEDAFFYTLLNDPNISASDGYLEASFVSRGATRVGLIFRQQNGQGYVFEIDRDNLVTGGRIGADGKLVRLYRREANFVNRYPENQMGVLVRGSRFMFYYNRELIGEFEDTTFSEGGWGLTVSMIQPVENGSVKFDNVMLYAP